jgi:hypothetical protein
MSIAKIMGAGSATNTRPEDDFFETPEWTTAALCEVENIPPVVWEACSGSGAIARVLRQRGIKVIESDLNPRNNQQRLDFLKTGTKLASAQVTNPPYKHASDWISHSHFLRLDYLALLLKADFLGAVERVQLVKTVGYPTRVWGLSKRPDFKNQGRPTMNCAWYVWDRWHNNDGAVLRFIDGPARRAKDAAKVNSHDLPWTDDTIRGILPELGGLPGVDWKQPVGKWPKETVINFVGTASRLIYQRGRVS